MRKLTSIALCATLLLSPVSFATPQNGEARTVPEVQKPSGPVYGEDRGIFSRVTKKSVKVAAHQVEHTNDDQKRAELERLRKELEEKQRALEEREKALAEERKEFEREKAERDRREKIKRDIERTKVIKFGECRAYAC